MSTHIVIVDHRNDWKPSFPGVILVTAKDYIEQSEFLKLKDIKIINLCRSYRYLSEGYYCSLLAEARRHKILPTVRTMTDLATKSTYTPNIEDLDELIQKSLSKNAQPSTQLDINIFFGHTEHRDLQELARQLFDTFRCPLMKVEFKRNGKWHLTAIKPTYLNNLTPAQEDFFITAFSSHVVKRWQEPKTKSVPRYDLAILHNPQDKMPPSTNRTLQKFIKVGKSLDIAVELIEKKDYSKLGEYDALFIRETTAIDHHTYRFAKKAESEGLIVIDDPDSIVRCTNKVYLAELLTANKIPTPKTMIAHKGNIKTTEKELGYPIVLKIPDGSFSRGVHKADNAQQLEEISTKLFKESDLLLAQEFVPTQFDWRIGVLNKNVIFACQYFMSKKHWQIVKHAPTGGIVAQGAYNAVHVRDVPEAVIKAATNAARLIGDGLYGVDIKETPKGVYLIEVNDNPNIDMGCEDGVLGEELYKTILLEFIRRIEQRGNKSGGST
ncbi:MAG: RimK family protein [Gammaproteobacteria bacterium]|nr:RimK family protein [Gammaproteobacteria bacterium]